MDSVGYILKLYSLTLSNMVDSYRNNITRPVPLKHDDDMNYIESLIMSKMNPFVLKKKYKDFMELTGMNILLLSQPSTEQEYDYVQHLYHSADGYVILTYRINELKTPFNNCLVSRNLAISFITHTVWKDNGKIRD